MRLCGTVYVISAFVVLVAQLVEVPSINASKSASFYDKSISSTITSYPVYATLVVYLLCLTVVWTRVFLSFVATLDDHDLRHITILNAGLAYAFRSLATLFKRLWRRFWLVFIVFVTIGVFWSTRILSIVCHCSAAAPCAAGPQASLGQLLCYRSSPANVYRCQIYLTLVHVVRLVSYGIVAFVALVVLTYAVVITYTVSGVHVPRKTIPSVGRHTSVIHSSGGPQASSLELLPEISICRLPIPIISAHELSSRFPKDYLIHPDFITKYELVAELGAGGNGFVLQARRRVDGQQVAVKFAYKHEWHTEYWTKHPKYGFVNDDVSVMDLARHENIITLLDVFSDDTYLYIVQELFGTLSYSANAYFQTYWPNGSRCLKSYIRANGPMSLEDAKYVFYQLVDAVAHLHSLGISHCDVKPDNILIDASSLKIKLIDFGNVLRIPEGRVPGKGKCIDNDSRYFHGTRRYMPPELHNGELYEANAADVWAMGLVLCYMLLAHLPFPDLDSIKMGRRVCHTGCDKFIEPVHFIVDSCLRAEMLLRPTAAELQLRDSYLPLALERGKLVGVDREKLLSILRYVKE